MAIPFTRAEGSTTTTVVGAFVGVVATPLGARTGDVIGCYPTKVVSNSEWATATSVAVDDTGVYAFADRTGVGVSTEYAIVRFPLP